MSTIIFHTPGQIDMRAFSTMGVNAKPNSTAPIGFFGTGLKYAVAVLCRLGASFTVHTGGVRYTFETRTLDFRGSEFRQVVMRRDSWFGTEGWRLGRAQKLPFTTQYGRNWEPWMAFRELYSNTLDEGGTTYEGRGDPMQTPQGLDPGSTFIAVGSCEPFTQAFRDRASIFVSLGDHPVRATLPGLEVREGPTQRLFYQGMRAKDVGKPAMFTYNFTAGQTLTEDRQLAHEYQVRALLANSIASSDDRALITAIVTAKEDTWEHGLQPGDYITPSATFRAVMAERPRGAGSGWGGYFGRHDDRPEVQRDDLWRDALRPWKVDGGDIISADGTPLLSKPYPMNDTRWAKLAGRIVTMANRDRGGQGEPASRPMEEGDLYDGVEGWCGPGGQVWIDGPEPDEPVNPHYVGEEDGDDVPF